MAVGPTHDSLDGQMQTVEPERERHRDAAQNFRFNVVERDLEADDGIGGHAASLRALFAAAQFQGSISSSLFRG